MFHRMKLYNEPYNKIKSGTKTIELRLNDEKRRKIKVGDTILFINTKTKKWLATTVKKLHHAESFKVLFDTIDNKVSMGFDEEDNRDLSQTMRQYYSKEEEEKNGVLGIEISSPKTEMDFPVKCEDEQLKYVVIAALYNGKIVLCKHKNRNTLEMPGGHIEAGETPTDAAIRELYEETGITELNGIKAVEPYYANSTEDETKGAYGMLFIADVKELPYKMPDFEMESISPVDISPYQERFDYINPELPTNLTYFEIYSVILYYIQRMIRNVDIEYSEEWEYYNRLKYYEEDVNVDYEHFDAESYCCYVMMRPDWSPEHWDRYASLTKVPATEENYKSVRESLFTWATEEYLWWLADNFSVEKLTSDIELMKQLRRVFRDDYVDQVLGIE